MRLPFGIYHKPETVPKNPEASIFNTMYVSK